MKNIAIGPAFFQNEKRAYADWRRAIIRECLQNSSDSNNCTKIEFYVSNDTISVFDNGDGMSRETLENVFLILGETTKNDGDFCGGFGIARNVVCFAQKSYTITSQDYICKGVGASYEIEDAPYNRGCSFEIETGETNTNWSEIIKEVLSLCSLKQEVFLNGERISSAYHKGRFNRSFTFADVFVNKSQKNNMIYVRSKGVWMFSVYTAAPVSVFVEIHPDHSKKVFNSNRDSLKYEFGKELDSFKDEIASETKSAFRDKKRAFIMKMNNFSFSVKRKILKEISITTTGETNGNTDSYRFAGMGDYRLTASPQNLPFWASDPTIKASIIVNEYNDAEVAAVVSKFDPVHFTGNENRYKLLKTWHLILQFIIDIFAEKTNLEFNWGIGFLFTDDRAAECRIMDDVYYLLLNPITFGLKIKYSINKKPDLAELVSLAQHEVAHIASMRHDEVFANVLTDLNTAIMHRFQEIVNILKDEI